MSCLFQSLGYFVHVSADVLRQQICDYLEQNPVVLQEGVHAQEVTQWSDDTPLEEYIQLMRQPHTWGGALEIKAFADMYACNVQVKGQRTIIFESSRPATREIHLLYTGNHYEAVVQEKKHVES